MKEMKEISNLDLRFFIYKKKVLLESFVVEKDSCYSFISCGDNISTSYYKAKFDGYFLSLLNQVLCSSMEFRIKILRNFCDNINCKNLVIKLIRPNRDVLDYYWCNIISRLVMERQVLDHAMSWFSTLGGAYSALGDYFEQCALIAAEISFKQFQIAVRLGDPPLVARCKLYMALSLIQQGRLKLAKSIILDQYDISKQYKDVRLFNMCHGIWAKLKYVIKLRKNGQ